MVNKNRVTMCLALIGLLAANAVYAGEKTLLQSRYSAPEINEPLLNKVNSYRVKLGKTLFFDTRLSGSNWISCATCHNPAMGWSDGLPTAIGEGQKVLGRATPTILNSAFNHLQMWDGRFRSLEDQAMGPIGAKGEMNQNPEELVAELKAIPGYVVMFNDAYPGRGITKDTISMAIASFERTIVSAPAPFDRWVAGDENAINAAAKRGFKLFEGKAHCSTCHAGYNFSDDGFHNIGLVSKDLGRFAVKAVAVTKGAFKTPTLRNIERTAPYMHNGAYKTLEEVIDHYVRGGDDKSNLSPNFKKAELNKYEKSDLLAFLRTLTSEPLNITYPDMPN
jgi:cytochrome c peroxidase